MMNKKLVLGGIIVILLLVAGCTATEAQKQNTNFHVVWTEYIQEGSFSTIIKISIPEDNVTCYLASGSYKGAMFCFEK